MKTLGKVFLGKESLINTTLFSLLGRYFKIPKCFVLGSFSLSVYKESVLRAWCGRGQMCCWNVPPGHVCCRVSVSTGSAAPGGHVYVGAVEPAPAHQLCLALTSQSASAPWPLLPVCREITISLKQEHAGVQEEGGPHPKVTRFQGHCEVYPFPESSWSYHVTSKMHLSYLRPGCFHKYLGNVACPFLCASCIAPSERPMEVLARSSDRWIRCRPENLLQTAPR